MATIILYPPITNSWMPAFKQTEAVRIYFSSSKYNNELEDVKYLQFTCVSQNNNQSILSSEYPLGIKMITKDQIYIDESRTGDDKYYFIIPPDDLRDPEVLINEPDNRVIGFQRDQNFKVQIRLASTEASDWDLSKTSLNAWINNNLDKLSEWSRVCLIRAIAPPIITLQMPMYQDESFILGTLDPTHINKIPFSFTGIQGKMSFEVTEQETLNNYRLIIYDNSDILLYDSEECFTDIENPNAIFHSIEYQFQDLTNYSFIFTYTTANGYSEQIIYPIYTEFNRYEDFVNARLFVMPDEENSCMVIRLKGFVENGALYVDYESNLEDAYVIYENQLQRLNSYSEGGELVQDYVTIIRASNIDNYTRWEDIHTEYIEVDEQTDYIYLDQTAEAGVLYKYAIQKRDTLGRRGSPLYTVEYLKTYVDEHSAPIDFEVIEDTVYWYDKGLQYLVTEVPADPVIFMPPSIHLVTKDYNMKIKLNEEVNGLKYNISENSTETIGSKYPFVMRNGNVEYRQFNISGTISTMINYETGEIWNPETHSFLENAYEKNRKDFYGNDYQYYQKYLNNQKIGITEDFIYEKKFRDKIIKFLKDGKVKLFKSSPEGNIMVRLTNVTFNPDKQLSRKIYSFQATAIEIADCTIDNYEKFNIIEPINYFGGEV